LLSKAISLNTSDIKKFVSLYQPNAKLRERIGMDCIVGSHVPPKGGKQIVRELENLIVQANTLPRDTRYAFEVHKSYETLHPFTDCNGRSGRAVWLWMMRVVPNIGFLHTWYYQSLQYSRI
jgi:Fic family protein